MHLIPRLAVMLQMVFLANCLVLQQHASAEAQIIELEGRYWFAESSARPLASRSGNLGYVVDAEAGLRFVPVRWLTLAAGYRFFDVRVGDDDAFGKLRLSGPFGAILNS